MTNNKQIDNDMKWLAMRFILSGLELYEGCLSDWYNLDDESASKVFDIAVAKLKAMADAGHIPHFDILSFDVDPCRSIKFTDNNIDKWLSCTQKHTQVSKTTE